MDKIIVKNLKQERRRGRVRSKIMGSADCPRLNVFRSNKGMFLQLIDDEEAKTILSVSSKDLEAEFKKDKKKLSKVDLARELGRLLAQKAKAKKIVKVVFDRGFYKYHGRVRAVAEGAREEGLKF